MPDQAACIYCGQSLDLPAGGLLDEDGDPATAPGLHSECVAAYQRSFLGSGEPSATVLMYEPGSLGPLTPGGE